MPAGHTEDASLRVERARPPEAPSLTLRLLGGFELGCGESTLELPGSAQRLVAVLALSDQPMHRASIAGRLWLDACEERAAASLRSTLWRIRRCTVGLPVVESSSHHLRLAAGVVVDVSAMTRLALALIGEGDREDVLDVSDRDLSGVLLPGWYEDWVLFERERLQQLQIHALEALAQRLTIRGRYGEAVQAGLAAVQREPLRESAHRTLISVHLAEGNVADAFRQYGTYERLLEGELGLEPSPQIRQLFQRHPGALTQR